MNHATDTEIQRLDALEREIDSLQLRLVEEDRDANDINVDALRGEELLQRAQTRAFMTRTQLDARRDEYIRLVRTIRARGRARSLPPVSLVQGGRRG